MFCHHTDRSRKNIPALFRQPQSGDADKSRKLSEWLTGSYFCKIAGCKHLALVRPMPLNDASKIDLVVKHPTRNGYELVAVDDGTVTDEPARYNLVVDKITAYLTFVVSGQFYKMYPDAVGKPVRCCIVCEREPNEAMRRLQGIKDRNDQDVRMEVWVGMKRDYIEKGLTNRSS